MWLNRFNLFHFSPASHYKFACQHMMVSSTVLLSVCSASLTTMSVLFLTIIESGISVSFFIGPSHIYLWIFLCWKKVLAVTLSFSLHTFISPDPLSFSASSPHCTATSSRTLDDRGVRVPAGVGITLPYLTGWTIG